MIKKPYNIALPVPLPLVFFSVLLVKKETVNGTIGNTQGVRKANKPPTNPNKNILNSSLP